MIYQYQLRVSITILAVVCLPLHVRSAQAPSLQYATGLILEDEDVYRSIPLGAATFRGSQLSPSVDLSNQFPTPGHQGKQSSCVGWAVGYALKSYQEHSERGWSLKDPEHLFSPSYIYNQISLGPGKGSRFQDALNLVQQQGVAPLRDFPYNEHSMSRNPDQHARQKAHNFTVANWRRIDHQNITEIKTHLAAGLPVLIGSSIDQGFYGLSRGEVFNYFDSSQTIGAHAMVLVGYDDAKNAFKVMNSWGTQWGDGGFGWIEYGTFLKMTSQAFVVQDVVIDDLMWVSKTKPAPNITRRKPMNIVKPDIIWKPMNKQPDILWERLTVSSNMRGQGVTEAPDIIWEPIQPQVDIVGEPATEAPDIIWEPIQPQTDIVGEPTTGAQDILWTSGSASQQASSDIGQDYKAYAQQQQVVHASFQQFFIDTESVDYISVKSEIARVLTQNEQILDQLNILFQHPLTSEERRQLQTQRNALEEDAWHLRNLQIYLHRMTSP